MGFELGRRCAGVRLCQGAAGIARRGRTPASARRCCRAAARPASAWAQPRLRARHGAVGLVLVGAGQIAGLRAPGHVGGDAAGVVELIAGGVDFDARALPLPPGLADGGRHAQLRGAWPGSRWRRLRRRPALRCCCARRAATAARRRRPRFARALVAVQAVGLVRDFQGRRLRRPGLCRLSAGRGRRRVAPAGPGPRAGAPRPRRRPAAGSGGLQRLRRCRLPRRCGWACAVPQAGSQAAATVARQQPGLRSSSSVHPMLQC